MNSRLRAPTHVAYNTTLTNISINFDSNKLLTPSRRTKIMNRTMYAIKFLRQNSKFWSFTIKGILL